jgi:hypothetical protein
MLRATFQLGSEKLRDFLRAEKENPEKFEMLPFHYVEISQQLLNMCAEIGVRKVNCSNIHSAPSDFEEPARLRTLLKDIEDQR